MGEIYRKKAIYLWFVFLISTGVKWGEEKLHPSPVGDGNPPCEAPKCGELGGDLMVPGTWCPTPSTSQPGGCVFKDLNTKLALEHKWASKWFNVDRGKVGRINFGDLGGWRKCQSRSSGMSLAWHMSWRCLSRGFRWEQDCTGSQQAWNPPLCFWPWICDAWAPGSQRGFVWQL